MSLMSDIQGTPERVWALLKILKAQGGELSRPALKNWMDPFESDPKGTALENTIGAAESLSLAESDKASVRLTVKSLPTDIVGFARLVHGRLVKTPLDHADSVVLEVLAWFMARSAREENTTWIADMATEDICNLIRKEIAVGADDKRFNSTRYPRWRDWMSFLGLGVDLPRSGNSSTFYPCITERLSGVVADPDGDLPLEEEIDAARFVKVVSTAMPYVDSGALFITAIGRVKTAPTPRQLSPVLSIALRDLNAEGVIELRMQGDARDAITLTNDPTEKVQAFRQVVVKKRRQ
jgi:hypothetical protein